MEINLNGMDDLLKRLEELGAASENIENKALREGGKYLKDKMVDNVYAMGLNRRSGTAENELYVSNVKDGVVEIGANKGKAFYLYFHEFGYYNPRIKRRMPARPFMGPTFETEKVNTQRIMAEVIKKRLGL